MSTLSAVRSASATRSVGWAALLAAFLTVGLITYGGWVRASGSGLGCPDWPLCEGSVVPGFERATAIEYGHRLFAGLTMLVVAAATFLSFRRRHADPVTYGLLTAAMVAILVQAGLGGVAVLTELHGAVVVAHLALAMVILALLTVAALGVLHTHHSRGLGVAAASGLLLAGAVVLLAGSSVVGTGLGAGCPGVPLCDSRSTTLAAALHTLHRTMGVVLAAAIVLAAVRMSVRGARGLPVALNHGVALVLAGQVMVGLLNVWWILPTGMRVLHLGLATLIWWGLVGAWALALRSRSA